MEKQAVKVNGVKIYPFNGFDEIIDFAIENPKLLVAINARKIYSATPQTRSIIESGIGYADGVGAVAALKKCGVTNAVKIAGCDLWLKIIERLSPQNKSFYLIGGKQDVIDDVVEKLNIQFPGIHISGYRNGYFNSEGDIEQTLSDVAQKQPDVVFVAMGSPTQELLMQRLQSVDPHAIYQGLGGSFDVYTGRFKRAPKWFVNHNMEGVYRVLTSFNKTKLMRGWMDIKFLTKLKLNCYSIEK